MKIAFGKMEGTGNIRDGKDATILIDGCRRGMLTSTVCGSGPFGSDAPFRVVSYTAEIWAEQVNDIARGEWDTRVVFGGWQSQNTDKVIMTPSAAKRKIKLWIAQQFENLK